METWGFVVTMSPMPTAAPDNLADLLRSPADFSQKVWAVTARIPRGSVATYGDVAAAIGATGAARAVGMALGRNPHAPAVPCHRVVGSDGSLTGFAGGLAKKARLLRDEGVPFIGPRVDISRCRYRPKSRP